jgi:hypothetical protein
MPHFHFGTLDFVVLLCSLAVPVVFSWFESWWGMPTKTFVER